MAATSIWSVKGWLGKVVLYAANPDKTTAHGGEEMQGFPAGNGEQGLSDVIAYAVSEEKTRRKDGGGNEAEIADEGAGTMQQYVTGVNCTPATARDEMMAAKKRYGKDSGIMAFHGYQSFASGECSPQTAHEIGVRLAEELWGERFQVIVATHLDKENHLHNHFVVNSVSFADGGRYHRTNQDYRDMREISDRLCREYGLSVIENPKAGKGKQYGEWRAEKEGKPTYRSMIKADVDEAVEKARTEKQFFQYLKDKGYSIKLGRDITVRMEGRDRGLKLARNFGGEYTIEAIRQRILSREPEPERKNVAERRKKKMTVKVRGHLHSRRKIGGLRGLYLHYCFLLGILPKNRPRKDTNRMHALFKEDLRKMESISRETRLLCHYHIDTAEQLFSLKENLEGQMAELADRRKHARYESRSMKDGEKREETKAEIAGLTERIRELRKEVVLCDGIAARSGVIKDKIKTVRNDSRTDRGKEGTDHEHIRRSR